MELPLRIRPIEFFSRICEPSLPSYMRATVVGGISAGSRGHPRTFGEKMILFVVPCCTHLGHILLPRRSRPIYRSNFLLPRAFHSLGCNLILSRIYAECVDQRGCSGQRSQRRPRVAAEVTRCHHQQSRKNVLPRDPAWSRVLIPVISRGRGARMLPPVTKPLSRGGGVSRMPQGCRGVVQLPKPRWKVSEVPFSLPVAVKSAWNACLGIAG
jgi:hypothetical protein